MRIAHLPGWAPLFLCPADGFAPDDGGGEFELGGAGGVADCCVREIGGVVYVAALTRDGGMVLDKLVVE